MTDWLGWDVPDWRGDPSVAAALRAACAELPRKCPERVGLARGACDVSPGGACACNGSCLRVATAAELERAVREYADRHTDR